MCSRDHPGIQKLADSFRMNARLRHAARAGAIIPSQIDCKMQVNSIYVAFVTRKAKPKARSGCPVCVSLERFGDRWSLLIIRDLMVRGYRTFSEFQNAGEGIATNVLANRLRRLIDSEIIYAEPDPHDRRSLHYRLTRKGIDLAPVMLELLIWAARNEQTAAPCAFIEQMEQNRQAVLAETYRRWEERDPTPLIPAFPSPKTSRRQPSR